MNLVIAIANVWLGNVWSTHCLYPTTPPFIPFHPFIVASHRRPPSSPSVVAVRGRRPFSPSIVTQRLWDRHAPVGADYVAPTPTTQLTVSLSYRFADCVVNRVRGNLESCSMPIPLRADYVAHKTQLTPSLCAKLADFVANSRVGDCRGRPESYRILNHGYPFFVFGVSELSMPPTSFVSTIPLVLASLSLP